MVSFLRFSHVFFQGFSHCKLVFEAISLCPNKEMEDGDIQDHQGSISGRHPITAHFLSGIQPHHPTGPLITNMWILHENPYWDTQTTRCQLIRVCPTGRARLRRTTIPSLSNIDQPGWYSQPADVQKRPINRSS